MSQIRLYIDEDAMSRALILGLRARSLDVISVNDTEQSGLDDEGQLALATSQERVLCTSNIRDFYRIHTEYLNRGQEHAGIILIPQQRYSIGEQIRRLLHLISAKSLEEMESRIEFLSMW